MEPHIRPLKIAGTSAFLPTSPEFAMKRLLAQGYDRIFQICKSYRFEPLSDTHNPEFTMLEWYRGHSNFEAIMDDVEDLLNRIASRVHGGPTFTHPNTGTQDVTRPWLRLTVEECFQRFAGLQLTELGDASALANVCFVRGWLGKDALDSKALAVPGAWDDLFFRVMMNAVEPALAKLGKPAIIYNYPESQAALANIATDARGFRWAKRFEVYAGGFELGNAFDELTDPLEQRRRFVKDMDLRRKLYGNDFPLNPIDEEFITALTHMPPSGGIAMGVDRLVMYFTGAKSIRDTLWLDSHWDEFPAPRN
jgi:lysyl-tRNA synthetase class 2